jgi:hypothetical protein
MRNAGFLRTTYHRARVGPSSATVRREFPQKANQRQHLASLHQPNPVLKRQHGNKTDMEMRATLISFATATSSNRKCDVTV